MKSASREQRVEVDQPDPHLRGPARPARRGRRPRPSSRTPRGAARPGRRSGPAPRCRRSSRRARRRCTATASTRRGAAPGAPARCAGPRRASGPTASSAAETMLEVGALTTITPDWVAARTSTLSRPTPARATTFRCGAAARASASTLVAERTSSASASAIAGSSSPRSAPLQVRISKSGPSASTVAGLSSSAMSTTGLVTAVSSLLVGEVGMHDAVRLSTLPEPDPVIRLCPRPPAALACRRGHRLTTPSPPAFAGPPLSSPGAPVSTTLTISGLDVAFAARTLVRASTWCSPTAA